MTRLCFKGFELDVDCRTLRHHGRPVRLPPIALRLLVHLARNRTRAVSCEELLREVWPGVHVTGSSIHQAIRALRKALAPHGDLVATVRGFGYRLAADAPAADREAAMEPFVGRDGALARLDASLDAARGGRGGLVLVTGEPGIGRSRFLRVGVDRARASGARAVLVRGGPFAAAAPYWPWCEIASELDCAPAADASDARASESARRRPVRPRRVRRTILEAARSGPVCLFLDDLDGCRATSWRMLEWIASTVDDSRLLLVVAARDAGAATPPERREAIGGLLRISGARRESLPPLSRGEVRAVAAAALGSEPSTRRVRELHSRSGGNPFLLHTLLAGRAPCALRSQRSALEDSSLRRAVAAHLEVVGAEARAWLRRAAVLGRDFDLALLAAICEETISEIRQAMVPAREAGVLETRANGRSLRFRHGLLAEVACAEVTDRERERIRRLARELRSAPGYLRSLPTLRVPATSTDAH